MKGENKGEIKGENKGENKDVDLSHMVPIFMVPKAKVIGIVGTRGRDSAADYRMVANQFRAIYKEGDTIVSGGCPKGGDKFAEQIAKRFQVPIMIHHAKWMKYGKPAGFIRNKDIARDADVLIVCISHYIAGGAENTMTEFQSMGKSEVYCV